MSNNLLLYSFHKIPLSLHLNARSHVLQRQATSKIFIYYMLPVKKVSWKKAELKLI